MFSPTYIREIFARQDWDMPGGSDGFGYRTRQLDAKCQEWLADHLEDLIEEHLTVPEYLVGNDSSDANNLVEDSSEGEIGGRVEQTRRSEDVVWKAQGHPYR